MSGAQSAAGAIQISVVIPVYNSGQFLRECIDSLLAQTQTSCEFIFVNDGSRDDSLEIIRSYQINDNRIFVIDQQNQGVSMARNNGIAAAKGDFLAFVDADDAIQPEMLETCYRLATKTNADIVCSGFIYEQDGHTLRLDMPFQYDDPFDRSRISGEVIPYMLRYDLLNSVANKMYRRNLIAKNGIIFPKGQALGEDAIFNLKAMGCAAQIIFTQYAGYFYREVAGSATRNILAKDYFGTLLRVYHFDYKPMLPAGFDDKQMQTLKDLRFVEQAVSYLSLYAKPNSEMTVTKRFKYVSDMILHPLMQKLVSKHWQTLTIKQSRFKKFVLYCIKYRQAKLLWLAQSYSNYRNKNT